MNFNYKLLFSLLLPIISLSSTGSESVGISDLLLQGSRGVGELFIEKSKEFPEFFNKTPKETCETPTQLGIFFCLVLPGLISENVPGDIHLSKLEGEITDIGDFVGTNLSQPGLGALLSGPVILEQVNIYYLNETLLDPCGISDASSVADMRIGMGVKINVVLEIVYGLNITIASIIPIYGKGVMSLSLGLDLSVDTTLKYCPVYEAMGLTDFEYNVILHPPLLSVSGLLGDHDFVEEIVKMINLQILSPLPIAFAYVEDFLHKGVVTFVEREGQKVLEQVIPCDPKFIMLGEILGDCP